jgi:membrane protein YdbS with pleckstrin-like domain
MSIADRSIAFHRKSFKLLIALIVAVLLLTIYCILTYEHYKLLAYSFIVFTTIISFPIVYSYRNWRFIEKNKKELDMLNISISNNLIFVKK